MSLPKIIVIVGPTASGKTDLAIEIAKEVDGEVIQADSRTVYKKMNIGTAKPEGERKMLDVPEDKEALRKTVKRDILELFREKPLFVDGIPHWGIDLVNPDESFTAAQFKSYAEQVIFDVLKRGKVPILAGGTGLYISAVVDNLQFSDAPPNIELRKELEHLTNEELEHRLWKIDPETADTIDAQNRRRLLRAIEIVETTGKKMADQQGRGEPKFDSLILGIDIDRKKLYERIDLRVDKMIAEGLVDEVRELKNEYGCKVNAMTGIGYRQICAFLDGYMKLNDAIEVLKRDSRHYAKRQLTWFRRDERIKWIKTGDEAHGLVKKWLM